MLFSTHGPVLDVVALRTSKMRGQAHIVYRDIGTATQAMRTLDGFEFFGMKMVRFIVERILVALRALANKASESYICKVQVQRDR